jgi:Cytochrome C'
MRRTPARTLLVAAALGLGLALLGSAGAADPATDPEFRAMVDQDARLIQQAADAVDKAASPKEKKVVARNAGSGIKSSALLMATYANDRIGGTDKAADARAAAIRDEAIKIYKAAADGNYKAAADAAKGLADVKPAAEAKKIDVTKELGELTQKEVMHNFLKTTQFGTNAEADIIANAKKATATPANTSLIAHRVLVMGELNKAIVKADNAADKKKWEDYNTKMIQATEGLLAAGKKKTSPADLGKAFTAVNASCTACHDDFK